MKLEEFRQRMESYRRAVEQEAKSLKDSQLVLDRLHTSYRQLDSTERALADQVLAEWALSADEGLRFDALTLIDDFKIAKTAPVLHELESRLTRSRSPGAPYELKKVQRILKSLEH